MRSEQCVVSVGSRVNYVVVFSPELADNATGIPLYVHSTWYKEARACQKLSRVNESRAEVPEHNQTDGNVALCYNKPTYHPNGYHRK